MSPKSYSDMLRKLAIFTALEIYIGVAVLRLTPDISEYLSEVEGGLLPITNIKGFDLLKANPTGLVLGLLAAFIFYQLQMHNKLEKIGGLRQRFDTEAIIFPMATALGISLTDTQKTKIASERHTVMRAIFYKYASSSGGTTTVDKHDIERALEAWTKFWAAEEAALVAIGFSIVEFCFGNVIAGLCFAFASLICAYMMTSMWKTLVGRARAQWEQIVADATARHDVSHYLNAL